MKRLLTCLMLLLIFSSLYAQKQQTRQSQIANQENAQKAEQLREEAVAAYREAVEAARQKGWPIRRELENGRVMELQRLAPNGMPLYYETNNINAARTVSTDQVWPGGGAGLSLTGSGMVIGEWDGGAVLGTHQELTGRITQVDGATSVSDHATHVAGTIIASGVNADAQGMAYQGSLDAYDWNSDESEMTSASANGLTLSNHSYGLITGWIFNYFGDGLWAWFGDPAISTTEDYNFGFYDSQAQSWDQIAFNAPGYLILKSAGNERDDDGPSAGSTHWVFVNGNWTQQTVTRDPDGQYDCIAHAAIAKNVLTVGAVNDIPNGYSVPGNVVQSSFSSWGPADDSRIKPDIVANGVGLTSSIGTGTSSYASFSGTSMSTPSTTGSLALLQQHYSNTHNGLLPLAATLKAIVIHTADEAGSADGPDYQNGWGLLNTERAAEVISADGNGATILESSLANNQPITLNIDVTTTEPLVATLVWTDPAGTPPNPSANPTTKALVNDLDLRITGNNQTYTPWRLDASNPTAAATQGDNISDNVEKIDIAAATPGTYTVTISNKGTLVNGGQNFSLVISSEADNTPPPGPNAKWEEIFDTTVQPSDWTIIDNDGSGTAWEFRQSINFTSGATVSPQAGQSFWFSNFNNANANGLIDEWLISPQITGDPDCDSLFFYAGAIGGSFIDSLKVFLSTTGNSINDFTNELDYFRVDGPTGAWHLYGFDISQWAGSNFYIAVNYYIENGGPSGSNSDNVWVDHFYATVDTSGSGGNNPPTVTNPIADQTVDEDFSTYTVADLDNVFDDLDNQSLNYSVSSDAIINAGINGSDLQLSAVANESGNATVIVSASDGTASVSDTFVVTINPVNDPPVLSNIPNVSFDEDDSATLSLNTYVSDVDHTTGQITFTARVNSATTAPFAKAGKPLAKIDTTDLMIVINASNVATFTTSADSAGQFSVTFTATDPDGGADSDDITVTVNAQNDPPTIVSPISDTNIDEDSGSNTLVGNLDNVFDDIDNTTLIYSASAEAGLAVTVSGSELTGTPDANFNGSVDVFVNASDGEFSVSDTFTVNVNPVNDPPAAFDLLEPANASVLNDFLAPVTFRWQASSDVDGDALNYTLRINSNSGNTNIDNIADSSYVFDGSNFFQENTSYTWSVVVTDGSAVVASTTTFNFTTPILTGIGSEDGLPGDFRLAQNFPNPFNPVTKIRYGLPHSANIRLSLYNAIGQEVMVLVSGTKEAGYHTIEVDGSQLSSGLYFYKLEADNFLQIRKMLLMK